MVVHPYIGIVISHKKEGSSDTCNHSDERRKLSEKTRTQKVTYCVISQVGNVQKRQIQREETRLMVRKGRGQSE